MKKFLEEQKKAREKVYKKLEQLNIWENCEWNMKKLINYELEKELDLEKMIEILNNKECCGCSSCCY